MKKVFSILLLMVSIGFVLAQGPMDKSPSEIQPGMISSGQAIESNNTTDGMKYTLTKGLVLSNVANEGNFTDFSGRKYSIQKNEKGYGLKIGNFSMNCSQCNLTQRKVENRTQLNFQLSNGRNAEIKVMPERASENALEQLRLRTCNESCKIELKEVGQGNESKLAYEIKTQKQAKVFGLFKTKMDVAAQIDAETGEAIKTKRPWWSFLASEQEE